MVRGWAVDMNKQPNFAGAAASLADGEFSQPLGWWASSFSYPSVREDKQRCLKFFGACCASPLARNTSLLSTQWAAA